MLEVVIAIGIFAVGMVAVIGLFTPVARSVTDLGDSGAATNIAGLLNEHLQRRASAAKSFTPVAALLKHSTGATTHELTTADANPNSTANDLRVDPQLLFASRDGTRIGAYGDTAVWGTVDSEKFFEIALIRNETLSPLGDPAADPPVNPDDSALVLAYTARIRWPAFVPDNSPQNDRKAVPAGYNDTAAVRFDHSRKQVLFVAGAITR